MKLIRARKLTLLKTNKQAKKGGADNSKLAKENQTLSEKLARESKSLSKT